MRVWPKMQSIFSPSSTLIISITTFAHNGISSIIHMLCGLHFLHSILENVQQKNKKSSVCRANRTREWAGGRPIAKEVEEEIEWKKKNIQTACDDTEDVSVKAHGNENNIIMTYISIISGASRAKNESYSIVQSTTSYIICTTYRYNVFLASGYGIFIVGNMYITRLNTLRPLQLFSSSFPKPASYLVGTEYFGFFLFHQDIDNTAIYIFVLPKVWVTRLLAADISFE